MEPRKKYKLRDLFANPTTPLAPATKGVVGDSEIPAAANHRHPIDITRAAGILDHVEVTANQAGIAGAAGAATALNGLAVAFNLATKRRVRLNAVVQALNTGANTNAIDIRDLAGATTYQISRYLASTVAETFPPIQRTLTLNAGAYSFRLWGYVGAGSMTIVASATAVGFFQAEDLGPG